MCDSFTVALNNSTMVVSERAILSEELKALQAMERILLQSIRRCKVRLAEIDAAKVQTERMEMIARANGTQAANRMLQWRPTGAASMLSLPVTVCPLNRRVSRSIMAREI